MKLEVRVDGGPVEVEVTRDENLLFTLRERLGLYGSKDGCWEGVCGSCSVLLDGELVCACLVPSIQLHGRTVETIAGLTASGRAGPVQEAFVQGGAIQCGFCTPGLIVAAVALLERNPHPNDEEIRSSLAGNLCRCTGYASVVRAVRSAGLA